MSSLSIDDPEDTSDPETTADEHETPGLMTKVVVHYHVGIRHYTDTEPSRIAVCADSAQVNAAMKAAQSAS